MSADDAYRWRLRAEQTARELSDSNAQLAAANEQLAENRALYRALFADNPLPAYVVERHSTRFLEINAATEQTYEFSRADLLGMTLRDIEPVSALTRADQRRSKLARNEATDGVWHHVTRTGRSLDVELSFHSVVWQRVDAWLIVARDVTRQRATQRALELRTRAMEASGNGMFIVAADRQAGTVRYVNTAMAEFAGRLPENLIGRSMSELFETADSLDIDQLIRRLNARPRNYVTVASRRDDAAAWLEIQITAVPDETGSVSHWIGVVRDITEKKHFEAKLAYRAGHDSLTGLANRETALGRLGEEIDRASAQTPGEAIAVLFLDIDGFKRINDRDGHDAGDAYLKAIAQRLSECARADDTLARIGDDEFLFVSCSRSSSGALAELTEELHDVFLTPVSHGGRALTAAMSVGIACFPEHGTDAETLLRRANLSMHMAKRRGGRGVEWFSDSIEREFRERGLIETRLRQAVDAEEFVLYYQPQVYMDTGRIVGVEALLRWPSAEPAFASPAVFIPVAEEIGLIRPIGRWVLDQACRDLATLRAEGHTELTMAVNVSVEQLREIAFTKAVAKALARYDLPADALEIEVTESVCMDHYGPAIDTLHALHELGVRLSIDDFGTGYSSLSYLSRLPIQRLKIDRSFVHDMIESENAGELVRMLTGLARTLGLETLAEGVETKAQGAALLDYDCRLAQGFFYSRPVSLDALKQFVADSHSSEG